MTEEDLSEARILAQMEAQKQIESRETEAQKNDPGNIDYHIRATVRNDMTQAISRPSFVVVLFDANGDLTDYNAGFVTLSSLQPNGMATVDVTFYDPPPDLSKYRVFIGN